MRHGPLYRQGHESNCSAACQASAVCRWLIAAGSNPSESRPAEGRESRPTDRDQRASQSTNRQLAKWCCSYCTAATGTKCHLKTHRNDRAGASYLSSNIGGASWLSTLHVRTYHIEGNRRDSVCLGRSCTHVGELLISSLPVTSPINPAGAIQRKVMTSLSTYLKIQAHTLSHPLIVRHAAAGSLSLRMCHAVTAAGGAAGRRKIARK